VDLQAVGERFGEMENALAPMAKSIQDATEQMQQLKENADFFTAGNKCMLCSSEFSRMKIYIVVFNLFVLIL